MNRMHVRIPVVLAFLGVLVASGAATGCYLRLIETRRRRA